MTNTITEDMIRKLFDQVYAQQAMIDALKQENIMMKELSQARHGMHQEKMLIKPPKPEYYKGKRDVVEINSWLDQIKRFRHCKLSCILFVWTWKRWVDKFGCRTQATKYFQLGFIL